MYVKKILKYACISALVSNTMYAYSLKESVEKVLSSNPEVIAEKNNQEAFKKYVDERKANYYPKIDIDGRLEKSNIDRRPDDTAKDSIQVDGYNAGISLNQMLYDGGLTPSLVREAKHNDLANKYRSQGSIDKVVLETIKAYNGLVQYNEMLDLTKNMISTNEDNLQIAKEKESISGEILETYQVDSKLNFLKEKYIEEKDLKSSKTSTFKRYVGTEPDGSENRTLIDETKVPGSLQQAVELAVLRNNEVLEQIEKIKAQREKIAQADSKFLPNLNLELKALTDSDITLEEKGKENRAYGRVNLSWNLFNGGKDYAISKQEELFLAEQKDRLDAITNKVVESVKVNYQRYIKNKDRIQVLKNYVMANENIVQVYRSEFEAGTRTFVDILDAQTVLYEAKKSLLNREFELYSNYYSLLNDFGTLTENALSSQPAPIVRKEVYRPMARMNNKSELNGLLGGESVSEVRAAVSSPSMSSNIPSNSSFLNAPSGYYTLNLTTTDGLAAANNFISKNGLNSSEAFTYTFGPSLKNAKVVYGIFGSASEAKSAMNRLPSSVLAHRPYIDKVNKHQKLYAKYHN